MTEMESLIYLVVLFFAIILVLWGFAWGVDRYFTIKDTLARRDAAHDEDALEEYE